MLVRQPPTFCRRSSRSGACRWSSDLLEIRTRALWTRSAGGKTRFDSSWFVMKKALLLWPAVTRSLLQAGRLCQHDWSRTSAPAEWALRSVLTICFRHDRRAALARRGVAHLSFPIDVQAKRLADDDESLGADVQHGTASNQIPQIQESYVRICRAINKCGGSLAEVDMAKRRELRDWPYAARPRTAHARAIRGIDPPLANGRFERIRSRSAPRRSSLSDMV
jgi:hypothetical protein